ncbi:hypothetical protein CROQUDRAFT_103429 [Cronartium quercuum f. sp. fusiforme G11]|uniref:Uncharacterized protein n=1 Tax=Cronartium quercuum f. sp. fusiforme G11 TaxID=708437 RepID=A0A9P6NQX7_9BASI|nr:hypothetical protein CROQUDRAFT_103429 [Cronartium quercuum f. sp. fusiforme G11]
MSLCLITTGTTTYRQSNKMDLSSDLRVDTQYTAAMLVDVLGNISSNNSSCIFPHIPLESPPKSMSINSSKLTRAHPSDIQVDTHYSPRALAMFFSDTDCPSLSPNAFSRHSACHSNILNISAYDTDSTSDFGEDIATDFSPSTLAALLGDDSGEILKYLLEPSNEDPVITSTKDEISDFEQNPTFIGHTPGTFPTGRSPVNHTIRREYSPLPTKFSLEGSGNTLARKSSYMKLRTRPADLSSISSTTKPKPVRRSSTHNGKRTFRPRKHARVCPTSRPVHVVKSTTDRPRVESLPNEHKRGDVTDSTNDKTPRELKLDSPALIPASPRKPLIVRLRVRLSCPPSMQEPIAVNSPSSNLHSSQSSSRDCLKNLESPTSIIESSRGPLIVRLKVGPSCQLSKKQLSATNFNGTKPQCSPHTSQALTEHCNVQLSNPLANVSVSPFKSKAPVPSRITLCAANQLKYGP